MVKELPSEVSQAISAFQSSQEEKRQQRLRKTKLRSEAEDLYKGTGNLINLYGRSQLVVVSEEIERSPGEFEEYQVLRTHRQTPWVEGISKEHNVEFSLRKELTADDVLIREKGSEDEHIIFHVGGYEVRDWNGTPMQDYRAAHETVDFIEMVLIRDFVPVAHHCHPSSPADVPKGLKFSDLPGKYRPKTL